MVGAFNLEITKLAQQLSEMIAFASAHSMPRVKSGGKSNHLSRRNRLRQGTGAATLAIELSNRGYAVVPERGLPSRETDCEAEVTRLLAKCHLAIHLVGSKHGMVPSGPSDKSVDILQNELAARQSRQRGLKRIVWIPSGTQSNDIQHQTFLESLTHNEDSQFGADVITGDFEYLKGTVLNTLQRLDEKQQPDSRL